MVFGGRGDAEEENWEAENCGHKESSPHRLAHNHFKIEKVSTAKLHFLIVSDATGQSIFLIEILQRLQK